MKHCFRYYVLIALALSISLPQASAAKDQAELFLSPSQGSLQVNDEFTVDLKINSEEPITSLKAYLNFDQKLLSITDIEIKGSVFPYWWEQSFDQDGKIQLQASIPSPGFEGEDGLVARIKLKPRQAGQTQISYDPSSLALKENDQNILDLTNSAQASFSVSGTNAGKVLPEQTIIVISIFSALAAIGLFLISKKKPAKARRK